jgi:hypothetical protein
MEEDRLAEIVLLEKGANLFQQAMREFDSLVPYTKKHFRTLFEKYKGWHYDGELFDFDYGDPHGVNLILTLTFRNGKIALTKDMELYDGGYLYGLWTIESAQDRIKELRE